MDTLGVGAPTSHVLVSTAITAASQVASQTRSADVEWEAGRRGNKLADTLRSLFVDQGWLSGS